MVGLMPTSDDSAAIANDLLPPSLMRPSSSEPVLLHFGAYGNLAIGIILDKILSAKGW
jgi:formyltetrahydrofolate synthetase